MSKRSTIDGIGKNWLIKIFILAFGHNSGIWVGWLRNAGMHSLHRVLFRLYLHCFYMLVDELQAFSVFIQYWSFMAFLIILALWFLTLQKTFQISSISNFFYLLFNFLALSCTSLYSGIKLGQKHSNIFIHMVNA